MGKTHWPSGPWRGGGGVGAGAPHLCHLEREVAVNAAFTAPGGGKAWRCGCGIGASRRRAPDGLAEVQCSPDGGLALRACLFRRRAGGVRRFPLTIQLRMAQRLRSNVEAAGSAIISQPCWRRAQGSSIDGLMRPRDVP